MPQQPQQIPILQSRGRSGGGGAASLAQVAIANFINDQGTAQKKMVDNFGKLQEAQAVEASQSASQMTQAMNQVVAREDERLSREERGQEKMKDREYQERYHEWTTKFQQQAAKDFAATQMRVASQMTAGRDFIQRMDANRVEFGDRIRGMRQALYDRDGIEQWVNTPGGLDRLKEMTKRLRVAELYHERDHQSDYTGEVAQEMARVQEQVLAGEPHADLTKLLTTKPKELLAPGTAEDWSDEEVEELYHAGGYPPGGLYGRDPDDPTLQKYRGFDPVEYMSNMWLLEDEQYFGLVHHKKFQDEYSAMRMESFRDMKEELGKLQEFSTKDYDRLATTVKDGAYYGVAGFVEELGSGKISPGTLTKSLTLKSGEFGAPDVTHAMATKLVESVFTSIAGPGSEVILKDLDALLSGEGDRGILDTEIELYKGFHMRNVLRHIDDQLMSMTVAPEVSVESGEEQDSLSMTLATQIFDMPLTQEKIELIRVLTMVPGDIQRGYRLEGAEYGRMRGTYATEVLGQIHRGVNRMFYLAKQKAMDLRDVVEAQPSLLTYQMKQGASTRYIDAIVASRLSDEPDADQADEAVRQRAMRQATREDYLAATIEVEGELPDEFDIEVETLKQAVKLSPFQAAGELIAGMVSHPELLAALYSGDYDLAPTLMPPVTGATLGEAQLALDRYMGASQRRRSRVQAEMKRRREAHAKRTQSGEGEGQEQAPQEEQGQPPVMGE